MDRISTFVMFVVIALSVVRNEANPAHSVFIKRPLPLSPHGPTDPNSSEEEPVPVQQQPAVMPSLPLRVVSSDISPTSIAAEEPENSSDTKKRQVSYFADDDDYHPQGSLKVYYPSSCRDDKKVPYRKLEMKNPEPVNYILVEKRMYSCQSDDAVMQLLRKSDGSIAGSLTADGRIGVDPTL